MFCMVQNKRRFSTANVILTKQWIAKIKRGNWIPSTYSFFCSKHIFPMDNTKTPKKQQYYQSFKFSVILANTNNIERKELPENSTNIPLTKTKK